MAQTTRHRGPQLPATHAPLSIFYIVLALVAVVGVALLAIAFTNRAPGLAPSSVTVEQAVRPLTVPSGVTAEGFAYKGDPNAPVKVVEYADFQCPACGLVFQQLEPIIDQ